MFFPHCFSSAYENGISNRVLELNLEKNPAPRRMATRAIRMAIEKELAVGPHLSEFILVNSSARELTGVYESFFKSLWSHQQLSPDLPFVYQPQRTIEMLWAEGS